MSYCVITIDVNKSRNIPERRILQNRILDALVIANKNFKEFLIADFVITLGDEWQGVFSDISQSYKVVSFFQEYFYPISLSFGVGEGEIETELFSKSVEMDGQVFHCSREALEYGKDTSQNVCYKTNDSTKDLLLNTTLHLLQILRESWTERQYQKVMLYKQLRKETLVANELNISQADVNKSLSAAHGRVYLEAEQRVNHYFEQLVLGAK